MSDFVDDEWYFRVYEQIYRERTPGQAVKDNEGEGLGKASVPGGPEGRA